MSHFSVTVRLDKSVPPEGLEAALAAALLPFKEAGCGDSDPEGLEKFLAFEDVEEENRKEWETDTVTRVKMPDGSLVPTHDERFRVEGEIGIGTNTHKVPDYLEQVEVPVKTEYPTFDKYMREYVGYERGPDPKTGKYGHWRNPNQKWDWYAIGGRWPGRIPVKGGVSKSARTTRKPLDFQEPGGGADFCRIKDIDLKAANATLNKAADKFWGEWNNLVGGAEFGPFDGPREMAMSVGLLDCVAESELTGKEWKKIKWDMRDRKDEQRYDVLRNVTAEEFDREYKFAFDNIATYCALDPKRGWIAPGEMGWFGCSSDEPKEYLEYKRGFRDWLAGGDQDDWIVLVDCHI